MHGGTGLSIASGRTIPKGEGKTKRRWGERLAVFASLVLVVLAAVASLALVQGINRQISDVGHTYEMRNQARELTIALSEAESSQRGYLLTGSPSYLEPYRRATAAIGTRMASLIAVTQADPAQAERVDSIVGEINSKIAEMSRTVQLVSNQREEEARRLVQTGMGERLMDAVRGPLDQFIAEENQKLLSRNQAIDESRRWLVGAIVAALAGAVVLAYSLLVRTQHVVSALAESQDVLLGEKALLERHVRERTVAVEEARAHAERERQRVEALLQDTNHRIGNSLATVSSLLGLQLMRTKSEQVQEALEAARSRVHAIASAHRRLRLGDDLETVNAAEFLDAVINDLQTTVSDAQEITLSGELEEIVIGARDATTIGILAGELVTNAIKHGFPDSRRGRVVISLRRDAGGVPVLGVSDDGVGMTGEADANGGGLGSVIVTQLAAQFGGVPRHSQSPGGGLCVHVALPGLVRPQATS